LQVAQKAACPEQWVHAADAREDHQAVLLRLDRLGEIGEQFLSSTDADL
jgi:hypothetical protein